MFSSNKIKYLTLALGFSLHSCQQNLAKFDSNSRSTPNLRIQCDDSPFVKKIKLLNPNLFYYLKEIKTDSDILNTKILKLDYPENNTEAPKLRKLIGLEYFINLEKLSINNQEISNLSSLSHLTQLKELNLSSNNIYAIEAIVKLKKLEKLNLSNNLLSKIPPLEDLKNLKVLSLDDNDIDDISPLSNLKTLKSFSINDNKVTKVDALRHLNKLREIKLNNNRIRLVSKLSNSPKLDYFSIKNNPIKDVQDIRFVLNKIKKENPILYRHLDKYNLQGDVLILEIEHLDISFNPDSRLPRLTSIRGLEHFKNLKKLNLSQQRISDFSPLENLNELRSLSLEQNGLSELPLFLIALRNLKALDLSNNAITDYYLDKLHILENLEELILENCFINRIEALSLLANLKRLCIKQNNIIDIHTLKDCHKLELLEVDNPKNENTYININCIRRENKALYKYITTQGIKSDQDILKTKILNLKFDKNNQIPKISSTRGLEFFSNLRKLYLDNQKINDLKWIASLLKLNALSLFNNEISELKHLQKLQNLYFLDLGVNSIPDEELTVFRHLIRLKQLNLSHNKISSIHDLTDLTRLKSLALSNNRIKTIEVLQNLKNLESLNLKMNFISNIDPLESLPNLKKLHLKINKVSKKGCFKKLIKRNNINFDSKKIKELNYSSYILIDIRKRNPSLYHALIQNEIYNDKLIKHTTSLNICHDTMYFPSILESIEGLEHFTNLKYLNLSNHLISDLTPLKNLTELKYLHLQNNRIVSAESLRNLEKIKTLNLHGNTNFDANLDFLRNFQNLKNLYIAHCNIKNLENLRFTPCLKRLYVYNNNLKEIRVLNFLNKIKELDISRNPITDLSPLKKHLFNYLKH